MSTLRTMTVDNVTYDIEDHATRTASRVIVSDANGLLAASDITPSNIVQKSSIPTTASRLIATNSSGALVASSLNPANVRHITYGTSDLTAGSSSLATGQIYLLYE